MGLPGEQGAAQLLATMAEGAGEVEIFVAARGTEGAMNRGGGKLCLGQGSRHPGVHPTLGQTLHQAGWGGRRCCPSVPSPGWAWEGGCAREGVQSREPPSPSPYATVHTITQGAAGERGGGPCHVAGAERQSGEGCGAPEVRGCRHFPGYPLCSEPVTKGNTLRTGQRRGVPGGAAAAGAAASHALPTMGSCLPPARGRKRVRAPRHLTKEHAADVG